MSFLEITYFSLGSVSFYSYRWINYVCVILGHSTVEILIFLHNSLCFFFYSYRLNNFLYFYWMDPSRDYLFLSELGQAFYSYRELIMCVWFWALLSLKYLIFIENHSVSFFNSCSLINFYSYRLITSREYLFFIRTRLVFLFLPLNKLCVCDFGSNNK
jgi:hypothetical protein